MEVKVLRCLPQHTNKPKHIQLGFPVQRKSTLPGPNTIYSGDVPSTRKIHPLFPQQSLREPGRRALPACGGEDGGLG